PKKLPCRLKASTRCVFATKMTPTPSPPPRRARPAGRNRQGPAPSEARSASAYNTMLLAHLFERIISVGSLRLIDARGRSFVFEGSPGASVAIRLHDPVLHWKLLVGPRLFLPEAYVDGALTIEEGSLYDLIDLMTTNIELLPEGFLGNNQNEASIPLR